MNMDKYVMWIHYERLHNHNKAKHNKTVCIFLGIYCILLCADMGWHGSNDYLDASGATRDPFNITLVQTLIIEYLHPL